MVFGLDFKHNDLSLHLLSSPTDSSTHTRIQMLGVAFGEVKGVFGGAYLKMAQWNMSVAQGEVRYWDRSE